MTWTWEEIFSLSLVRSGLQGRGQVANASMIGEAQKAASLLLDEWDGLGLSLPAISTNITFNTVAGQVMYLLGPGGTPAFAIRPEAIVTATLTISTGPVIKITLSELDYETYTVIPIPSNQSQPFNWSMNRKWPQAEFYLYPAPDKVYPIILNCKVKWQDTITTPDINPFVVAAVPSGYVNALVDNISLKLAQNWRLETATLISKAAAGRYTIAVNVMSQYRKKDNHAGIGAFSDAIIRAGANP